MRNEKLDWEYLDHRLNNSLLWGEKNATETWYTSLKPSKFLVFKMVKNKKIRHFVWEILDINHDIKYKFSISAI